MPSTPSPVKFAVVGCGHIGKRHAGMILENEEAELVALCDILPKGALGLSDTLATIPFFSTLENTLAESDCEVVVICTPNALHAPQALRVLDANRHVVIEKPMALRRSDCEKVLHRALNVSKQVFCVMQNRYSPPAQWLKKILEEKRLGDIYMVTVQCFWNRDDRYYLPKGEPHNWHGKKSLDGGPLFTQFSHFVDMMLWLLGDIKNIQSRTANFNHTHSTDFEDSGTVSFEFENGAIGTFSYSTAVWDKNFESTMTLIGSKGTVKIGGQYMDKVAYCHIENYEMPELPASFPPNEYGGYTGSAANHHFVIENVLDVLKGRKEITTNALEGMKTVEIIETMYRNVE